MKLFEPLGLKFSVIIPVYNDENILRFVLEGKLYSCLWNIVIRRSFYINNKINFSYDINYGEDTFYSLIIFFTLLKRKIKTKLKYLIKK